MKLHAPCTFAAVALLAWFAAPAAQSATITIEPDDYSHMQTLNNASPFVTLSTGAPPTNAPTFDVGAYTVTEGASTGTKVFSHALGIPFWNTSRTLRMDFHVPVTNVSLDYIPSGFFDENYAGRLEAYSASGMLLASYTTALLDKGTFETMTVSAPQIAYALAYPPTDPFGSLDHLQFNVIPEPTAFGLALVALAAPLAVGRRGHSPKQA